MSSSPTDQIPNALDALRAVTHALSVLKSPNNGTAEPRREWPTVETKREPLTFAKPGYFGKVLIEGSIQVKAFYAALAEVGYEAYADCNGDTVIRTVESGDCHRVQVRAERAYNPTHRTTIATRFEPGETVRVRDRDEDQE